VKTDIDPTQRAALKKIATTCLCQKARKAARTLTRFYDRRFAGSGIEPTQFHLLVGIRLTEPVTVNQLASHLALDRTTLTRNVALLQKSGIIEIARGQDARQRKLSLTKAGRKMLEKSLPRWNRAQQSAVSALGQENFARLSEALSVLSKFAPTPEVPEHD
jgi:DNA-binding MarR family transcriptional regulator